MQKIPSTETHSELSSKFIIPNFLLFTTQRPSINQSKPSIMRVISFTLATIVATASMVIAAPAEASGAATKWICPNGWKYCGVSWPLKALLLSDPFLTYEIHRRATGPLARLQVSTSKFYYLWHVWHLLMDGLSSCNPNTSVSIKFIWQRITWN